MQNKSTVLQSVIIIIIVINIMHSIITNGIEKEIERSTCKRRTEKDCKTNHSSNLEDVRPLDESHQRQEAAVGPAMNGNTTEVHKVELLCHVLQSLHLVFNLHLALT